MQQERLEEAPSQPLVWEAPELVIADVATTTLNGVAPGVDGPLLKS